MPYPRRKVWVVLKQEDKATSTGLSPTESDVHLLVWGKETLGVYPLLSP